MSKFQPRKPILLIRPCVRPVKKFVSVTQISGRGHLWSARPHFFFSHTYRQNIFVNICKVLDLFLTRIFCILGENSLAAKKVCVGSRSASYWSLSQFSTSRFPAIQQLLHVCLQHPISGQHCSQLGIHTEVNLTKVCIHDL